VIVNDIIVESPLHGAVSRPSYGSIRQPLGCQRHGRSGMRQHRPASTNAVLDALHPLGATHFNVPLTPAKIWAAINNTKLSVAQNRKMLFSVLSRIESL